MGNFMKNPKNILNNHHNQNDQPPAKKAKNEASFQLGLLNIRSNTNIKFIDESGVKKQIKTTMMVETSITQNYPLEALKENLGENLQSITTFTPVKNITAVSEFSSPTVIESEHGNILKRVAKYGPVSLFSNDPTYSLVESTATVNQLDSENNFFHSDVYLAIKKTQDQCKQQSTRITQKNLENTKKENKKHGSTRSQNKEMAETGFSPALASATQYAAATQVFSHVRWEWLHLIAHAIEGSKTQQAGNLVAGTTHANTDMIFIEREMQYLASHYPQGFSLEIKANLIPSTHIATTIEYTIKTDDFTIPFTFNAQATNQPHILYKDYIHSLIKALIETKTNNDEDQTTKSKHSHLFFDKKELSVENTSTQPSRKRKRDVNS
ncbi:MAG: hypothetical protein ACD_46C00023G0003 [uncultured bacterium]|nr:MAG: hypothetical protein ACD_46C00023G0003 [uncultured bacterium]